VHFQGHHEPPFTQAAAGDIPPGSIKSIEMWAKIASNMPASLHGRACENYSLSRLRVSVQDQRIGEMSKRRKKPMTRAEIHRGLRIANGICSTRLSAPEVNPGGERVGAGRKAALRTRAKSGCACDLAKAASRPVAPRFRRLPTWQHQGKDRARRVRMRAAGAMLSRLRSLNKSRRHSGRRRQPGRPLSPAAVDERL